MYQVVILDAIGGKAEILEATLGRRLRDLNLDAGMDLDFLGPDDLGRLRTDSPRVGVLFSDGPAGQAFSGQAQVLLNSSAVVIPAVTSLDNFSSKVPDVLTSTNGMKLDPADARLEQVAGLILELFGLLRRRRRLFISYKRSESAAVAQQLHDALDERSFDVFLDTLSVRAADVFQEQLWHRMTDSDVVILLYTATVHSSGWVQQEIDRASGMKITVLQVIWPGVDRNPKTELFEPLYLEDGDFTPGTPRELMASKAAEICALTESLRAHSLANREAELVGMLRQKAAGYQLTTGIQPMRYIDVRCDAQTLVRVIPAVGVPDSETFQGSALASVDGVVPKQIVLLYDSLNIATGWRNHLDWLQQYLPVKTVKLFEMDQWLSRICS